MTASDPAGGVRLRPGRAEDLGFAAFVYLRAMGPTVQRAVGLDPEQQAALLMTQWILAEVRVIVANGQDVGWVQIASTEAAIFIRNFCVDPEYQRLGVGSAVMRLIIDEAERRGEELTLGVAKGNPARRLYERFGFRVTHDDAQHDYMRRYNTGAATER